jgi:hypothetical protein
MIADFFTKPLQGAPFRQFRDFIMNIDPDYTAAPAMNPRSVLGIENQENAINVDNVKHSDVAPGTWIPVKQKKCSISSDRDARTSARHRVPAPQGDFRVAEAHSLFKIWFTSIKPLVPGEPLLLLSVQRSERLRPRNVLSTPREDA